MFLRTIFFLPFLALPATAEPPVLNLPIDCELGTTCFIQQFMDLDDGEGVRDFGCGTATYDGHKGTDFRLTARKDMDAGVNVLASAGGRVVGMRDGVRDHQVRTDADRAAIKDRECGNGAAIDHGDGWQTQYCHLKQGSVTVKQGQIVEKGEVLGQVGLSGQTQFPHVHISVRKDGRRVDPFLGAEAQCGGLAEGNLWADELQGAMIYQPTQVINIGFADGRVSLDDIEDGKFEGFIPSRTSAALVGYVRAINLVTGDRMRITFIGPDGEIAANTYDPVERAKATQMYFAGKKAPAGGWPAGEYRVVGDVLRDGAVVDSETLEKTAE